MKYKILRFIVKTFRFKRKPFTKDEKIRILERYLNDDADSIMFTVMISSCGGATIGSMFGNKGMIIGAIICPIIGLYSRYKRREDYKNQIEELKNGR